MKAQIEILAGEHERFAPNMTVKLKPRQRLIAIHPDRIILEVDMPDITVNRPAVDGGDTVGEGEG